MAPINPIRKALVKKQLKKGVDAKNAMINAGYSERTAHNATRLGVVKTCKAEIAKEFKMSDITPEKILKDLEYAKELALQNKKKDLTNFIAACGWIGKYLAMFTDKLEAKQEIVVKPEEKDELSRIRGSLLSNRG